jgi:hypothetical protein
LNQSSHSRTFHLATEHTDKSGFLFRVIRGLEPYICETAGDLAAFVAGLLLLA